MRGTDPHREHRGNEIPSASRGSVMTAPILCLSRTSRSSVSKRVMVGLVKRTSVKARERFGVEFIASGVSNWIIWMLGRPAVRSVSIWGRRPQSPVRQVGLMPVVLPERGMPVQVEFMRKYKVAAALEPYMRQQVASRSAILERRPSEGVLPGAASPQVPGWRAFALGCEVRCG